MLPGAAWRAPGCPLIWGGYKVAAVLDQWGRVQHVSTALGVLRTWHGPPAVSKSYRAAHAVSCKQIHQSGFVCTFVGRDPKLQDCRQSLHCLQQKEWSTHFPKLP